jgi:hypothetical protein
LDRHELAEFVDVASQSFGDAKVRIEEFEVFDGRSLTVRTDNLSVQALDPDLSRGKVQVADRPFLLAVDPNPWAAANMTDGVESFVGDRFDPSSLGMDRDGLFDNTDSWKREILCYTQSGHRWPPLDNFLVGKQVYYPLEIPDVHFSFVA